MTVAELIEFLKTQPQDLPVAYRLWSEQKLLEPGRITTNQACLPRPDGWIQDFRDDMPYQTYLMLPG